jgi:hypothetical protein
MLLRLPNETNTGMVIHDTACGKCTQPAQACAYPGLKGTDTDNCNMLVLMAFASRPFAGRNTRHRAAQMACDACAYIEPHSSSAPSAL